MHLAMEKKVSLAESIKKEMKDLQELGQYPFLTKHI